jgi:sugar phosphate isomerase/epimerase
MQRRSFLAASGAAMAQTTISPVKFGIDLFSVRSSGWNAFQYLDYCAKFKVKVVHFSEIRFLGSLEEEHVRRVKAHADKYGIELEIGMRSICPTSKLFDPAQGTAEEQLTRLIKAGRAAASKLVRAFLGSMADRTGDLPIEAHIENTVKVLRAVRSRAMDANLKIAIENHAGDMQGRELKMLIEEAGKDFVGACIDSGNPVWTLEDPHVTLETLHPYVLTSHVRDSQLWRVPEGVAVRWTRMGEGNVDIDAYLRKYLELCPGRAISMEIIVTGPRTFPVFDPKFWDGYRNVPAWQFSRFLAAADKGKPSPAPPKPADAAAQERSDLEASIQYTQRLLNL